MLTRGQEPAIAAVRSMIVGGAPHAILLTGPGSVGKTTLALDLAAGLLCDAPLAADRPCRACRACRRVASGNHPDLHRLAPGGLGNQIKLKSTLADPRPGVLDLIEELSLMPMEGGARVAIVEGASRMNEDAQNALLKTLEEPPAGVVIVLCADDEERLLPTIRSRCQRIRLGTLSGREIETWLVDRALADAPTAARAARLADGRPGLALSYIRAPEALAARAELDRTLLDMLAARPSARLAALVGLLARSRDLATALATAGLTAE
ncbi:MAG TPA: DNA polymerase III subunit, partial [Candidatus Limnocylindrales bacterium]